MIGIDPSASPDAEVEPVEADDEVMTEPSGSVLRVRAAVAKAD